MMSAVGAECHLDGPFAVREARQAVTLDRSSRPGVGCVVRNIRVHCLRRNRARFLNHFWRSSVKRRKVKVEF